VLVHEVIAAIAIGSRGASASEASARRWCGWLGPATLC
jgi:hypothetical protein